MKCEEFAKFLDNYENLTEQEKSEMNDHASVCNECKAELDFFLSMIAAAKSLPKIEPPIDFMDKLNERIDMEEKNITAAKRISRHLRKNWRQYTTAAACFALVAVLTANRGVLLDSFTDNSNSEGGVISEETVSTNDSKADDTASSVTPAQTSDNAETSETPPFAGVSEAPVSVALQGGGTQTAAPAVRRSGTSQQSGTASRSQSSVSSSAQSAATGSVSLDTEAEVTENNTSAVSEIKETKEGDYGIALVGTLNSISSETASISYDLKPEEVSASLKASEIRDNYSLAGDGESIAYGKYYITDENGNPVDDDEEPKAIGSLKISSSDAEKAMDVISQYPHDEDGDLYTIDSEALSRMLSELSDEGVSYTDYTPGGSSNVKFRLVFN